MCSPGSIPPRLSPQGAGRPVPPSPVRPVPSPVGVSGGGARIGRPPQWTASRSRKLARLYVYTTLSIEKIIKVLEDDVFKPRKNSAQKTIHNMLDNDPRYLRPESRIEMDRRINSVSISSHRLRLKRQEPPPPYEEALAPVKEEDSLSPGHVPARPEKSAAINTSLSERLPHERSFSQDAELFSTPYSAISPKTELPPSCSVFVGGPEIVPQHTFTAGGGCQIGFSREPRLSTSTDITTSSIRDLKSRVSGCSTRYARQVTTLLKHLSISSSSDLTNVTHGHRPSLCYTEAIQPPDPEVFESFPEPGYAVPGDFINAGRLNCAGFPGQDHFGGRCWCAISDAIATEKNVWLAPGGELSARAQSVLAEPTEDNLMSRDCFGNTALHLFATLEGFQDVLFDMVMSCTDIDATNNAGQTFLHVLNVDWFSNYVEDPNAQLKHLLSFLRDAHPDLVYIRDVYGRTFFHRAHAVVRDSEILAQILSPFDPALASRRDAFGFNPFANTKLGGEGPFIPPRRQSEVSSLRDGSPPSSSGRLTPRASHENEDSFVAYHARLIQIVHSSYDNTRIEDEEGRNGLHCLAEAIINPQAMNDQRQALTTGRGVKRKHDRKETPESSPEGPLAPRLRHLEALLKVQPPIDVNHYDKQGNTVLMAFISLIADDQDDKARTLCAILETLLRAGARLEARNRRGETALLVAARLGRKIALAALLEHGANVHARDVDGRGVLELVDLTCRVATDDLPLYARLEACRVLLTGRRDWGVVQNPTVLLEWRTRHRFDEFTFSFA